MRWQLRAISTGTSEVQATPPPPPEQDSWTPPEARTSRALILVVGSAIAIAFSLLLAGQTILSMLDHGHSWRRIFGWHLASWGFWVPLAPWIVGLGERARWGEEGTSRRLLGLCTLSALLSAGQLAASAAVATLLQPYDPVSTIRFVRFVEIEFLPWVVVDLMVFWCLVALGSTIAANRRSRAHLLRESRLEAELARAQLEALRLEIQPHFLFNTLNSVAALIRRRSNDRALEMVLGLSQLLRSTLDRSDRHLVPLREEVDFVERYVALQKARFGERLRVGFDVAEEVAELPVPWLVLQPLVENAIRHGVAPRAAGGTIAIRAASERGELVIEVSDDGPGPGTEEPVAGIGLQNVRSRLHQLHGDAASLVLARTGDRTIVTLRMPATTDLRLASAG